MAETRRRPPVNNAGNGAEAAAYHVRRSLEDLQKGSRTAKEHAAASLCAMAMNPSNVAIIVEEGGIEPLVKASADHGNQLGAENAMKTLCAIIFCDPDNGTAVFDAGAVKVRHAQPTQSIAYHPALVLLHSDALPPPTLVRLFQGRCLREEATGSPSQPRERSPLSLGPSTTTRRHYEKT
jgi:hypothetical protein